ncbi:SET domain-containing protein [Dentipellis sp. KUC8613]|nr:SET domain-containing protein [Dentipellis sp. KUC8613]
MAPPESAKITALLAWCANNGVSIDSRIELVDDPDAGISVRSRRESIPCPSSLVTIPKSAVLSAKSCFLSALINHVPYGIGAHLALAFAVHSELLRGRESRWFGYLQSLPREDDGVGIALFWGSDLVSGENDLATADGREARRWLVRTQASTHLRSETGASITDQVRDWYHDVAKPRLAALGLPTTLRGFCHAYALVLSRAFVVDSFHGLAMVPVADAFNHTQDHHVHLETEYDVCAECGSLSECPHDDDLTAGPPDLVPPGASQAGPDVDNSCEMVSNAPIQANEEVFNTYGEKLTNAELLVRYGFALDGNENDIISWTAEEVWDAGCRGGESAWGAVDMFMEVVATWRGFQGWTDSALVSNADGANGEDSAGGIGTPRDAPPLCLMADGTISHSLWVICALGAMYKVGNNGGGSESAERTIGILKRVAYAQLHMENASASGDDETGAGREEEKIYEKMVAEVVRTVVSLCQGRLDRLVEGTQLKSSADVGEYADALPNYKLPPQSPLSDVSPRPLLLIQPPLPPPPMDTDWCLSCNRHLDGVAGVYCSPECYDNDNPSSSAPSDIFEQSQYSHPPATSSSTNRWKGNDHAGILAWARDVSPGLPSEPSSSRDSSPRTPRPKLLDMHLQPLRPSLFVSSPRPAQPEPSKPILTPQSSDHAVFHRHSADDLSMTTSFLTESVVTPASSRFQSPAPQKPSVLGALATQVRTWVAPSANKPAPPPKRSPRDPSIQGLDPPFTVFARAHRGAVSPLAVPDEDLLPASKSGWDGREEDMLAGWFASQVEKKGNKMAVPTSRPPLDIAEHPAFRSRGRRTARAYAS